MSKPIELGFRSSPQQRRVWRLQNDGLTSCASLCALRIEGDLDKRALRNALTETVARHEILHTAFRLPAGLTVPLQVILEPGPVHLLEVDFRDLSLESQAAGATDLYFSLGCVQLDLEQGEGWRAALVWIGPCEHELLLMLSTACADAGAFEPLAADLLAAYNRLRTGGTEEAEPPLQYADVAEWQNSLLEREDTAERVETWREHWRDHEIDARIALPLPMEEREATPGPFAPREALLPIARETSAALARLAEAWGCSLQVLILTAWMAVIQRGTGRDETLVGLLYTGRDTEELRGVIGPLARYLPIAARFSPEVPLKKAVAGIRQAIAEAEAWGDYFSWDHVTGNGAGGFPVCFEAMAESWELAVDGLRVFPVQLARNISIFDSFSLALSCSGSGEDLRLTLRYDSRRFRREAAHRLAGRLTALLGSIAARPETSVTDHPVMAEEEWSRWLELSVAPPAADQGWQSKTLHAVFEEQVNRAPNRLALVADNVRLTFRELDMRANRLAHHLLAADAGPEVPVALYLERSAEAVVALLAVWKAGSAYVPLDPTQPAERLAYLLEDTGTHLLVTDARLASGLPGAKRVPGLRTVLLDEEAAAIALRPAERPAGEAGPRNLAYIIYTSGSTGRPKGVQIEHRSALHLLAALEAAVLTPLAEFGLRPDPLLASLNAPMIFDASVQQLLLLLAGHALCVVPEDIRADGAALLSFLREQKVDLLDCTPSQLRLLVNEGLLDGPATPRIVLTAGEAVDEPLWRRLSRADRIICFNLYGPTECSVDATFHCIEPGSDRPTIGRPLAGYEVFLLDRTLQPMPPGALGEICLGGAGLARGYQLRPDLTSERFVPHPFSGRPGERLYRTGDLGRHLPDGDLEFLGRLDHQVKIRGFRIELEEIEAALACLPGVRAAVVVVHEDRAETGPGDRRLVAYLVGDFLADALRQELRQQLPEYMIPAAFVTLEALPLAPNGKVDRKALPAPKWNGRAEDRLAPRTPVEEILAGIWAELLGLEQVGADDHFFDLGGHSLLATQVMSRLRSAFGVEMPLRDLFAAPKLADLATRVDVARRAGTGLLAPPLVPVSREERLPLSFAQQRLWFIDQLEPGSPLYNIPVALRIEGPLDRAVLAHCLGEIVRRHEALRTVFATLDAEPVQVIQPAVPFGLHEVDLSELPESSRESLALALAGEETRRPFDLASGPLLRGLLLRLAEGDHAVALTMHHVVSDGWSMGVLVSEVAALYTALAAGRKSPLPELPVQYADFAVWQRSWLQGEVLEQEISFWRRQLAGLPPLLELPTDRPRPAIQSYRGATRPVRLPAELTRQIEALARREGATLFMVLLAGFQALLARYSGQDDLAVGSPIAGRNRAEIEGLIGFFVNTLVMRGDLAGRPAFRELLGRVRETALAAYMYQDVPFEKLVEELAPERSLAYTPLFQVMLVLQNAPLGNLEIQDLRLRPINVEGTNAKFDLTVSLAEHNGGLIGVVEHVTDLFDAATVDRLIRHFGHLLAGMAATDRPVAELLLLGEAERHQVLMEWNDTSQALDGALVHAAISSRAGRSSGALAIAWDGGEMTYDEMERRSNRLARRLRRLGVGPEVFVGLCCDRSGDLVVGILGILKAGGAYVPLDPEYPEERLQHMLADCGAPVLVAQERTGGLAATTGARLVLLDAPQPVGLEEDGPVPPAALPEHPAYAIYTSGSTGRPKGVVVTHRALVSSTRARLAFYREPVEAYLLASSFAFDSSVAGLFWTLWDGGTLILNRDQHRFDLPDLLATLARHRASHLLCLPSLYSLILEHAEPGQLSSLKTVIVAGEACPPALIAQHAAQLPAVTLVNEYGPTEGTVWCSACILTAASPSRVVSIGRPIGNVCLHLLDRELGPVPAGIHGELWIAGASLARGYLGRPELTAERFLPDPFSEALGARMYRTGDRVRWLPDGSLDFLGRLDHQVKVRGFRIELGEIEAALETLPGTREAVVVAREDTPGDRRLVAYLVGDAPADALRQALRERLPDYMVPAAFVTLEALPVTPNGKLDYKALPAPERTHTATGVYTAPQTTLEQTIAGIWQEVLGLDQVGREDNFFDAGGHSLLMLQVHARLRERLGRNLTVVELFQYPTVRALAEHLDAEGEEKSVLSTVAALAPLERPGLGFAVIGMAGRFPGAADIEELWTNLREGREAVVFFTDEEMQAAGVSQEMLADPRYVKSGTVLEGIELFDAEFFGFSPREAEMMDPQHRLFLEASWQALEDAGYDPRSVPGRVGVWGGADMSTYAFHLLARPDLLRAAGLWATQQGIDKDFVPTRVSYELNLRGPSVGVQTACSTSLVAVHHACRSLASGECDTALAGGVRISASQRSGYLYEEGGISSPDGHCRAFDASARGTISGNGVGVVVLKRLEDALRDGDTIRAVIRGTAINNDGSLKVGFTAPSVEGQAEVIATAQAAAGVSPAAISYVEAHGTGTPLGDPIEIAALTRAFRLSGTRTNEMGFCGLGSIKTNIGHLGAAAGVAGLIKTVLALEHRQIPPSLHFETPNPAIDFVNSPFRVVDRLTDWPADGAPRRAGVSSFGIGGTNAHAVLEEAPPAEPSGATRPFQLLQLSARTPGALEETTVQLASWLERHTETPLADVAHTLRRGRHAFEHRRMLVCASREDALAALQSRDPERLLTRWRENEPPAVAWLLPGQGSQHPGMGRDLYNSEPVFRREIDACAERLDARLGRDLRELLFASSGMELAATRFAQPALFAVEHALARLWLSWGLRPQALIGHSLGEYVAACLAGVLSLDDALALVAARGELMQELPSGAMLSVDLSEGEALAEIAATPHLSLAAVNSPGQCVVSGSAEEIDGLAERLAQRATPCRRLQTSHAFHSGMMEPVLSRFAEVVARVALQPPSIPYLSNLTGTWATAAEVTDPGYWVRHLRETVRFGDGVSRLLAELPPGAVLLEVGPGQALGRLVRGQAAGRTVLASMPHPGSSGSGTAALLHAVGRLWLAGVEIDWQGFQEEERRRRVSMPTYPFQRRRHWVELNRAGLPGGVAPVALLLPEGAAEDPAWTAALQARGFQVVAVPPDRARPEALDDLLALRHPAQEPAPPEAHPASGHVRPGIDTPFEEPRNEIERRLAAIWENLLGIDRAGIHDDFFELGGHSLLATRLLSRVRESFASEIQMETFFAEPTIARLAVHLAAADAPQRSGSNRIPRAQREGDLPLSFAQQQIWVLQQLDPANPAYSLPSALRLQGAFDPEAVGWSLREIVARHEVLRTTYPAVQGWPVQRIARETPVTLTLIDLGLLAEPQAQSEIRDLLERDALRPFDLARDPAFRAALIRLADDDHVLCLSFHHVCFDGWSWGVLFSELAALYAARRAGHPSPLPSLSLQYADFAVWQRQRAGEIEGQLEWWKERLSRQTPLQLVPDRLHRGGKPAGANEMFWLTQDLAGSLQTLGQTEGCTLFVVLLALFKVLLHQRTGREEISVGSPVAGRLSSEVEGLIGNFVNTLVLCTDLAGDPSFRELLGRVRETALEAHSHQEAPYEQLAAALAGMGRRHRLFEVWFVLHNTPEPALTLSGLTAASIPVSGKAPRHDLSFSLWPGPRGVQATLEYRTDLFLNSTVRQMAEDFTILAEAVVTDAGLRCSALAGLLGRARQERQETRKQAAKVAGLERLRAKRREAV